MAVKPTVRLLSSHISHMAFLSVWRDKTQSEKCCEIIEREVAPLLRLTDRTRSSTSRSGGLAC